VLALRDNCVTAKNFIRKLTTLNLNPASYETCFVLHDTAQSFYAIIQGKLSHVQCVCPLQHVCFSFCVAFSAITSTHESARTYTRTCVTWMWSLVYVLAQTALQRNMVTNATCFEQMRSRVYVHARATKHACTQCVCKSHLVCVSRSPTFKLNNWYKILQLSTRINTI